MNTKSKKVAVIGAGISGLTCTYWLKKQGLDVTLFEKNSFAGGCIKTEIDGDFLIEYGPNSSLDTTPLIDKLLSELEIIDEKIFASKESNKRYILRGGKIHPLPMSPGKFLFTNLFSFSAKLRLLKEPFIKTKGNKYETIAEFTKRRLGQEFLDYAINPFVAGVFAGNPKDINVMTSFPKLYELEQKYGSLILGAIKSSRKRKKNKEKSKQSARTFSFKKGMQTLVNAIEKNIKNYIVFNCKIEKIESKYEVEKKYILHLKKNEVSQKLMFDAVIISSPSYATSDLLSNFNHNVSGYLKAVYYPPVNVIYTGFKKSKINFKLDGFGYLIPEKEKRKILGSLWSSVLFSGRAPDGYYALTSFIGGARSPELTTLDDNDLINTTLKELDSVLGIKDKPDIVKIIRWQQAIPQYNKSYSDLFDIVETFMVNNKGLFICNNFYKGISISDCIKSADSTVTNVINYLEN